LRRKGAFVSVGLYIRLMEFGLNVDAVGRYHWDII